MTKPTVLIVDDEDIVRLMLSESLSGAGYEVLEASDGEQALTLLSHTNCPIVISDWDMPQIDGLELCKTIREQQSSGYIYFILLTSHDQPEDRVRGLHAGADDFISKPFDYAELLARVSCGERLLQLETREALIFSLAKLAERRDNETGQHLERVRRYAQLLAQHYVNRSSGINRKANSFTHADQQFVKLIYQTSPLHDIGKVGIPDSILLKPGRLTAQEFEIMKTHTTIGAETLKETCDQYGNTAFLKIAHEIALTHHERFDGTGYPHGLAGEAIPLSGRIVAIADVYDALTSVRVYKPAFSHQRSVEIIRESSGTHFDPVLVEIFLACADKFEAIRANHEDFAPCITTPLAPVPELTAAKC